MEWCWAGRSRSLRAGRRSCVPPPRPSFSLYVGAGASRGLILMIRALHRHGGKEEGECQVPAFLGLCVLHMDCLHASVLLVTWDRSRVFNAYLFGCLYRWLRVVWKDGLVSA